MKVVYGCLASIVGGFLILIFYKEWNYFRAMAVPMIIGGWIILALGFANHMTNRQLHKHIRDPHKTGYWK